MDLGDYSLLLLEFNLFLRNGPQNKEYLTDREVLLLKQCNNFLKNLSNQKNTMSGNFTCVMGLSSTYSKGIDQRRININTTEINSFDLNAIEQTNNLIVEMLHKNTFYVDLNNYSRVKAFIKEITELSIMRSGIPDSEIRGIDKPEINISHISKSN